MSNLSSQDRETLNNFNQMTVGQIFRRARQDQNFGIQHIATHLNISLGHLEAIESDDVKSLPPKVYAVGFVRAYADLLTLDGEKMSYLFKVQAYGKKQTDHEKAIVKPTLSPVTIEESLVENVGAIPLLIIRIVGMMVIAGLIIFVALLFLSPSRNAQDISVPNVPQTLLEDSEGKDVKVSEATELIPPSHGKNNEKDTALEPIDLVVRPNDGATGYGANPLQSDLAFKMMDENWLEIRMAQGGEVFIAKTLKKGDVVYIPRGDDVLLTTGNAGVIQVYLDNEILGIVGKDGEIVRLRPFSVKALRLQR